MAKERSFKALTLYFVKEPLCKPVLCEGQKDAPDVVWQVACKAEHLALGAAMERRGHQVDDTHEHAYLGKSPWLRLLCQDFSNFLARTSQS